MSAPALIAILLYFSLMLMIGLYAWRGASGDARGYLLGGRRLGPAVTALSAGASDMSAWIMMGLPGAMVATGLVSSWIALGLLLGAWANYLLVAPRLRLYTEQAGDAITLPDYFENRFADHGRLLRIIASLVIVVFFTLYTSAGMVAGGVLFETAFGQDYQLGLWLTAGVVVAYTLLGGFHAVCLTDFVQGCIILLALLLVPLAALIGVGGPSAAAELVSRQQADFLSLFQGMGGLAIVSSLAWGLGYFGQPHIIVRFMAIHEVQALTRARRIGISWMGLALLGALLTGFSGLAYLLDRGLPVGDPETIFIQMSQLLFPPALGGFLMAAILAAIMSTISSQLLVSSSSLSRDFYKAFLRPRASEAQVVLVSRLAVVLVALMALFLAQDRSTTILSLVSNAWAGFGAAFGPLILLSLFWSGMNRRGALAGMVAGALTVLLWIYVPLTVAGEPLSAWLYEIVPGFLVSCLVTVLVSRLSGGPAPQVRQGFTRMEASLSGRAGP